MLGILSKHQLNLGFIVSVLIYLILFLLSKDFPFFWDVTQQVSRKAHFFLENDLRWVPIDIHEGHPPLIPLIHAGLWTLFGKSLWVSHGIGLLAGIGCVLLINKMVYHSFDTTLKPLIVLVLCLEPVILTQTMLSGADIWLFLGFLLFWSGAERKKNGLVILGSLLLAFTSIRGIILLLALSTYYVATTQVPVKKRFIKLMIPAFISLSIYYVFHYLEYGWLIISPSDRWSEGRELSNMQGIFKNGLVILFRFIENFKLVYWLIIPFSLTFLWKKKWITALKHPLFILFLFLFCWNLPVWLFSSNAIGLRYLMVPFFILSIWLMKISIERTTKKAGNILLSAMLTANLAAHFLIYPIQLSQSWDASLAHWSYYAAREECVEKMNKNEHLSIQAGFPLKGNLGYQDLANYDLIIQGYDEQSTGRKLMSPIFNHSQGELLSTQKCIPLNETLRGRVFYELCE